MVVGCVPPLCCLVSLCSSIFFQGQDKWGQGRGAFFQSFLKLGEQRSGPNAGIFPVGWLDT